MVTFHFCKKLSWKRISKYFMNTSTPLLTSHYYFYHCSAANLTIKCLLIAETFFSRHKNGKEVAHSKRKYNGVRCTALVPTSEPHLSPTNLDKITVNPFKSPTMYGILWLPACHPELWESSIYFCITPHTVFWAFL